MRQKFFANGKRLEHELRAYHASFGPGEPNMARLHAAARLGKADGDFSGTTPDGRAVLVEAKEVTSEPRFPLKMVKPHQLRGLVDVGRAGGVAVAIVRVEAVTWALRWDALQGAMVAWVGGGPASLSPADLDRVGARLVGVRWWGVALPGWSERQRGLFAEVKDG